MSLIMHITFQQCLKQKQSLKKQPFYFKCNLEIVLVAALQTRPGRYDLCRRGQQRLRANQLQGRLHLRHDEEEQEQQTGRVQRTPVNLVCFKILHDCALVTLFPSCCLHSASTFVPYFNNRD